MDPLRQNRYESFRSPEKSRDIRVGEAIVLFGWSSDDRVGWRLPGGGCTQDYMTALRVCTQMARLIRKAKELP
jgi:hypothetical protein